MIIPLVGTLFSSHLSARTVQKETPFQIQSGDNVTIVSDKVIRHAEGDLFEAIGHVVIIHKNESLYGERASLGSESGQIHVEGNVRYIGPMLTMSGQELTYNMKNRFLSLKNGRIEAKGYTVVGEYFARISPREIMARNAEYTTCLDCPESWTVYGKEIFITLDQYIHVSNAIVKTKRSPAFFLPYAIFPIKRKRQSGALFPEFSLSSKRGFTYRQPLFFTLGENKDITLTPSTLGKRGYAQEIEYRHIVGEKKWFQLDYFTNWDRIYYPYEEKRLRWDDSSPSGHTYQRMMGNYEHHFQFGNNLTHHFVYSRMRETDMLSDFERHTNRFVSGPDLPQWGFLDAKNSFFNLSLEGSHNHNLLLKDAREYDFEYVQTMPRISLSTTPFPLLQTEYPFLHNISVGVDNRFTYFKQNHMTANRYRNRLIRNAERLEVYPYVDWNLGTVGPLFFKTHLQRELQYYHFPRRMDYSRRDSFHKTGTVVVSETFFELDRIWGPAYMESVPIDKVELLETSNESDKAKSENQGCCIGKLPPTYYTNENVGVSRDGYRHSLFFNIRHYYTTNQRMRGNEDFARQIEVAEGSFDDIDIPRDLQKEIGTLETRRKISERNTLELRIFNSLFLKKARSFNYNSDGQFLRDNFIYSKLAYFNISQGVEFDTGEDKKKVSDRLTRLLVQTAFPIGNWTVSAQEYYFYQKNRQDSTVVLTYRFPMASLYFLGNYNTIDYDFPQRETTIGVSIRPISTINLVGNYTFDITKRHFVKSNLGVEYAPLNNCWRAALSYNEKIRENRNEKEFIFNFLINFGEGRFTSLLRPMNEEGSSF